jgi:phage-related tail fiber protein
LGGTFSKFSSGNGTTNFRLPDLRGEFIRGWDKGRGIDSGRAIGTWQGGTIIVGEDAVNSVNIANVASNPGKWGMDPASTQVLPTDLVGMAIASGFTWDVDAAASTHVGIARPRNVALLMTVRYR